MTAQEVAVHILMRNHAILGTIEHGNLRILDVLNELASDFLRVQRASAYRLLENRRIGQYEEMIVLKAAADCVLFYDDEHEAPARRKYALVEKQTHSALIILPNHEIHGGIMIRGQPDPRQVLGSEAPLFFPIIDAHLSSIFDGECSIHVPIVFVNKTKVSLLHIEKSDASGYH